MLRRALTVVLLALPLIAQAEPVRITPQAQRRIPASPIRKRVLALAADPAHGGHITKSSLREAWVGLRLERRGLVPASIKRESTGAAEFVDGQRQLWDVKGFDSRWPIGQGGFEPQRVEASLRREIGAGQHVMLDTRHLTSADLATLGSLVLRNGWSKQVAWYPTAPGRN